MWSKAQLPPAGWLQSVINMDDRIAYNQVTFILAHMSDDGLDDNANV